MTERVLYTMSSELPTIIRQLESSDPTLRNAAMQRLRDFSEMTAIWRGRPVSRRKVLRAGATFAAMSLKRDD